MTKRIEFFDGFTSETTPNTVIVSAGGVIGIWQGAWTAINFNKDDAVFFEGSTYICTVDTVSNEDPTDTNFWDLAALKGTDGSQGIQGDQGDQGDQGIQGVSGPQGIQGDDGAGIPSGGTTGQWLVKSSATDFDTAWGDSISGNKTFDDNVIVTGDLTVNGTTTTINTATLDVTDANITVNDGGNQAAADAQDAGITVEMSDATDAVIGYDSTTTSKFRVGEVGSEAEIASISHSQTLTNKVIDADNNTISNLAHGAEVDNPTTGAHGVSGTFVGTSDSQTLTNKIIDGDNNTISNLAHGAEVDDLSSGVHGVTGDVVGTTDTQVITGKDVDGGTASNTSRMTVPKDTTVNLDLLTDKEATIAYDTTLNALVINDGTGWSAITGGGGGASFTDWTRVSTSNGYGGTNSDIPRFSVIEDNVTTAGDITYVDSATLGNSFTINTTGIYSIHYSQSTGTGTGHIGISLNSSQLSTNIGSITVNDRIAISENPDNSGIGFCSTTLHLTATDVVRAHDQAFAGGGNTNAMFTITRVG